MKITIEVENDKTGEIDFRAECLSVESAVQELYRFERIQDREKLAEIQMDDV